MKPEARAGIGGRIAGRVLGWLAALVLASAVPAAAAAPALVVEVADAIGPSSADLIVRSIARAGDSGAPVLVIRLDTPGGLDTSMRQVVQAILASRVPVVVYVGPEGARAASAGTYILYSAHVAAMAPATTLGAATPVAIGLPGAPRSPTGGDQGEKRDRADDGSGASDAMSAKAVNDAAAFIRGLAQLHGRNAEWAERAVREAVSLTADEALRARVVDVVAKDVAGLLEAIDGRLVTVRDAPVRLATRGVAIETVLPDWRHRVLSVIANPGFALILLMIGIYGLLFEFSSPGFGLPGIVGAICLLLGLFALQLLPVNYAGLALILLGVALLVAELLTPSFGILGSGGVVAFVAGGLLLFDRDVPGFAVSLGLILGLAATSAAVVLAGGGMVLRARRRPVVSGREDMIGATGEVLSAGEGGAWASVRGERWKVVARETLAPGQQVRVTGLRGLTLEVQPVRDHDDGKGQGS